MATFIQLNNQPKTVNTWHFLNQLQDWQNDLDFWNMECNHFLRLMNWKNLYISDLPNPLQNQLQLFADEEIAVLMQQLNEYRAKWKERETHDFKKYSRKIYLDYHQMKTKFRSLKIKALSGLIKSRVSVQIF